jgi:FkbM family methyltransferase
MISHAQNFEDVLLARAFSAGAPAGAIGFYVDIGAHHPDHASVTRHFYDRGWCGINVEPVKSFHDELVRARPRDRNLCAVVGARSGMATLHRVGSTGLSSLDPGVAERASELGERVVEEAVEMLTLAELCDRHAPAAIDFLKIDVEGAEHDVIAGGDWSRHRPRVVVVEATKPGTRVPSWSPWEPLLLAAHYRFAWFDALNRFYVREEDAHLVEHLALPPNVFDDFVTASHAAALGRTRELEAKVERLRGRIAATKARTWKGRLRRLLGDGPR